MSIMTPYAAAKIVNEALDANNINKTIPPQMMYTYANKGYIATKIVEGKKRITTEGLQEWLKGYIARLTKTTTDATDRVDEDQLELFEVEA